MSAPHRHSHHRGRHSRSLAVRADAAHGRRVFALMFAIACALLVAFGATDARAGGGSASASEGDLEVTKVDTHKFPYVRISFTVDDDVRQLPDMTIHENDGKTISNFKVYNGRLGYYESNPKTVIMLAIDASDSMKSPKIDNARAAALKLIDQAHGNDRIGIVTFGGTTEVVQQPTEDLDALRSAVKGITLTRGTMLFDGVEEAIGAFPDDATRRVVLLLSDGADSGSSASDTKVIEHATENNIEIYSVGIEGGSFTAGPMRKLSNSTGGSFASVSSAAQLGSVYDRLGKELLHGYWLEYRSSQAGGQDVKVVLSTDEYGESTTSYTTPTLKGSDGTIHVSAAPVAPTTRPAVRLPSGPPGVLVASAPFGLVLGFLVWLHMQKRSRPNLAARIEPYTKVQVSRLGSDADEKKKLSSAALAPLYKVTEAFLGKSSLFRKLGAMLEQANLPLRPVELLYMMLAGAVVGLIFGGVMLKAVAFVIIFGAVGLLAPYMWVKLKARKRKKMFEEQLADVLSTVAASLKAGHSFNQSIAAVIKEAPNPTAEELQRVLTEARLGLPLEDALEAMAVRMGSQDFEFAVTTVNIQRTVGGSLSEILEMVGDTVRNRQQFRKKVKALTSMGRMSAYVLLGMPIFMGGVITLLSREYMEPLLFTETGHMMMIAGGFFMFLGYVACMKIVNIKT